VWPAVDVCGSSGGHRLFVGLKSAPPIPLKLRNYQWVTSSSATRGSYFISRLFRVLLRLSLKEVTACSVPKYTRFV